MITLPVYVMDKDGEITTIAAIKTTKGDVFEKLESFCSTHTEASVEQVKRATRDLREKAKQLEFVEEELVSTQQKLEDKDTQISNLVEQLKEKAAEHITRVATISEETWVNIESDILEDYKVKRIAKRNNVSETSVYKKIEQMKLAGTYLID